MNPAEQPVVANHPVQSTTREPLIPCIPLAEHPLALLLADPVYAALAVPRFFSAGVIRVHHLVRNLAKRRAKPRRRQRRVRGGGIRRSQNQTGRGRQRQNGVPQNRHKLRQHLYRYQNCESYGNVCFVSCTKHSDIRAALKASPHRCFIVLYLLGCPGNAAPRIALRLSRHGVVRLKDLRRDSTCATGVCRRM